jgi:ribulose 1,5-bisphosphate carboxylase large subunit-like protein
MQDEMFMSVERYARYVKRGWPMPTIAAGIYPGQLQAYYDLLGPDVAYFLGGAVALHKDGPVAGAKLCVKAIRSAVELRQKAGRGEVKAFPDKLVKELEENYSHLKEPKSSFNYVSPVALYQEYKKLKPWAAR